MPPDSIISDLKKFVSPECIEALEKTVEDAKSQMMSDREKKNNDDTDDAKSKSKGGDKDQKKKEKQKKTLVEWPQKSGSQFGQEPPVSHRKEWRRQRRYLWFWKP